MPIYNRLPEHFEELDVVIAGGGTAGCVVASRLAEADTKLSILLIEYGKNNHDVPSVIYPALFPMNIMLDSDTAIFYETEVCPQLNGRSPIVATGGILGGGSSINFMMYTRAQRDDFDSWKTEGWTADELIPYMQKLETYHGHGNKEVHGYGGPVQISDGGFVCPPTRDDLLAAASKLGFPIFEDLQDLDTNNGFGAWNKSISPDGKRQDTAHTYLHPLLRDGRHPNLHVLTETKVSRVLIDENGVADGVELFTIPMETRNNPGEPIAQYVKAKKQIIVSAGALGSPQILERSGIGSPEILATAGIKQVVSDLPGVGHEYQDHNLVFYPYKVHLGPESTFKHVLSGEENVTKAIAAKSAVLGWNTIDVASKILPSESEVAALGPRFQEAWNRDYKEYPNRPMMLIGAASAALGDTSSNIEGDILSTATYTAYPYSRGSIHIKASAPHIAASFHPGFFTDQHDNDIKMLLWAYKKQRELMRRTRMYRGEVASGHPRFPNGSLAACVDLPLNQDYKPDTVSDLVYSPEDDLAIEAFLRNTVETTWHSLGTCKMAPREEMGVVDPYLNVFGVQGLKVADLSIVPENVGANTCNTAMIIGEKAADILIKTLIL